MGDDGHVDLVCACMCASTLALTVKSSMHATLPPKMAVRPMYTASRRNLGPNTISVAMGDPASGL
jgi:hypothetical protein